MEGEKEKKKFKLPKIKARDVAYVLTILFMLASLYFTIGASYTDYANRNSAGKGVFGWATDRLADLTFGQVLTVTNVFTWNGRAAIFAVILYSFVLIRNKNTLYQFNENHIDVRNVIIHFLNLVFVTSIFAAFIEGGEIFGLSASTYIILSIIFTATSMKTLSGFGWILATVAIVNNLNGFSKWGINGVFYIILSYVSIVIQILVLKIFEFDLNELKNDFAGTKKTITDSVKQSIEATKSGVKTVTSTVTSAAVTAATGVPVVGLKNDDNSK